MNLEKFVEIYYKQGYELNSAQAKVAQDIILLKLSESKYKDKLSLLLKIQYQNQSDFRQIKSCK